MRTKRRLATLAVALALPVAFSLATAGAAAADDGMTHDSIRPDMTYDSVSPDMTHD